MNVWILTICTLAAIAVIWQVVREEMMIRRVSQRVDANFLRLSRPPSWTALASAEDINPEVIKRLTLFEGICARELGFTFLCRLRELSADGELLGVRCVLLDPTRTIAATFATSHVRAELAFRSFGANFSDRVIYCSDSKSSAFTLPENFTVLQVAKTTAEMTMYGRLVEALNAIPAKPLPFDDTGAYIAWQESMWKDKFAMRSRADFVIDLPSLRKLAPARISEARLTRIHKAIMRRHGK